MANDHDHREILPYERPLQTWRTAQSYSQTSAKDQHAARKVQMQPADNSITSDEHASGWHRQA